MYAVPSAPIAAELWMSELPKTGSGTGTSEVLKVRSKLSWRGPLYGLRPVCCASTWYIGRPTVTGDGAPVGAAQAETTIPVIASAAAQERKRRTRVVCGHLASLG